MKYTVQYIGDYSGLLYFLKNQNKGTKDKLEAYLFSSLLFARKMVKKWKKNNKSKSSFKIVPI